MVRKEITWFPIFQEGVRLLKQPEYVKKGTAVNLGKWTITKKINKFGRNTVLQERQNVIYLFI